MMGPSHAISGAAAWVAVTATAVPALGLYPMTPVAVILGAVVAAGAALLPDADHRSATIAQSVPIAGALAAEAIDVVTGGHRHGMHSILAVATVIAGTFGLSFLIWTPEGWDRSLQIGPALAVAACTTFAVKVLDIVKGWLIAWMAGILTAAAVLAWAPGEFAWLPVCIGVGFAVHLLGDALTIEGVPFLWPLRPKAPRLVRETPIVRLLWHGNGYFAVPVLGHAGSIRERALTVPLALYALWGVGASVVLFLQSAG